jgi:hypothetical protein
MVNKMKEMVEVQDEPTIETSEKGDSGSEVVVEWVDQKPETESDDGNDGSEEKEAAEDEEEVQAEKPKRGRPKNSGRKKP